MQNYTYEKRPQLILCILSYMNRQQAEDAIAATRGLSLKDARQYMRRAGVQFPECLANDL